MNQSQFHHFSHPRWTHQAGAAARRWLSLVALVGLLAVEPATAERVPPPVAVDTGRLLVGAIHCPLWNDGSRWQSLPTFTGAFRGKLKPTAEEAITAQEDLWKSMPQPNIPTLSMGWDSEPWGLSESKIQWRLGPAEYKNLCQRAKSLLDSRPTGAVESRLVLLDNWNEFGEGHYLLPTRGFGFGHLDAVREVFAPQAPPHTDIAPLDHGFGPYDSRFRSATRSIRSNRQP